MSRRSAPAAEHRGLPWWGRLLVVLVCEVAVLGLAWMIRGEDPYSVFAQVSLVRWAAIVILPFVVVLCGPGAWSLKLHGVFAMVGAVALGFGVPAVTTLYRELAAAPVDATLVSLDSASARMLVELPGGDRVTSWRTDGGPSRPGDAVTVYADPAGILTPDNRDLRPDAAGRTAEIAGLTALALWQIPVLAVLFRRREWSMLQRYGGSDDAPSVPRPS